MIDWLETIWKNYAIVSALGRSSLVTRIVSNGSINRGLCVLNLPSPPPPELLKCLVIKNQIESISLKSSSLGRYSWINAVRSYANLSPISLSDWKIYLLNSEIACALSARFIVVFKRLDRESTCQSTGMSFIIKVNPDPYARDVIKLLLWAASW